MALASFTLAILGNARIVDNYDARVVLGKKCSKHAYYNLLYLTNFQMCLAKSWFWAKFYFPGEILNKPTGYTGQQ